MDKIKILYRRLNECHFQYKISKTKSNYSNVWVECTKIERELDAIELYEISNETRRAELHKLRKLMLARIGELENKVKTKINNYKF